MNNFENYFSFLSRDQKLFFYQVMILIIIATILEAIGVSLIIPTIAVFLDDDLLTSYPFAENILAILGNPKKIKLIFYTLFLFNLFYIFKFIFLLFSTNIQSKFYKNLSTTTADHLMRGYSNMPYLFHVNTNSSILIRNLTVQVPLLIHTYKMLFSLFSELFLILFLLLFLFIYDYQSTTVCLLIFSIFGGIFYFFTKDKLYTWGREKMNLESEKLKNITNIFRGIKDIKIFDTEAYFLNRFKKVNDPLNDIEKKQFFLQQIPKYLLEVVTLLSLSVAIYFLLIRTSSNEFNHVIILWKHFIQFRVQVHITP
jgi:ABC-type multidrug transport system fused ATPase/permease subunit